MSRAYGIDTSTRIHREQWAELVGRHGLAYAVVRCHRSNGLLDANAPATILDAHAAGVPRVDVYHFPHWSPERGHAAAQVNASVNALRQAGAAFRCYWIDVELLDGAPSGGWSGDPAKNARFLRELVEAAEALGLSVGIYSLASAWKALMGSDTSFGQGRYPLWYAHPDDHADFNDFVPFGGWKQPSIKQYRHDTTLSLAAGSVRCDENFRPEDTATGVLSPGALSAGEAAALFAAGYRFCGRTLGAPGAAGALTVEEAERLHGAGLHILPWQSTSPPVVSAYQGGEDGRAAAAMARAVNVPAGTNVFCRVTAPADAPAGALREYHQSWYREVSAAGYVPGLCVCDDRLTGYALYDSLSVQHYWAWTGAVPDVHIRGYQIEPLPAPSVAGAPAGLTAFGAHADNRQGSPRLWAPRAAHKGADFIAALPDSRGPAREQKMLDAVRAGLHVPVRWAPVRSTIAGHEATIFVSADALAIGEPGDSVRITVTHPTAQRIADELGAVLPTARIIDLIHAQAEVRLPPCTQYHETLMSTTRWMVKHSARVDALVAGRPGLASNVGKVWVLTNRLVGRPDRSANYGWHSPNGPYVMCDGTKGWQPLGLAHDTNHTDYSQIIRLVRRDVIVDGEAMDIDDVLRSPVLCGLVSHEGPLRILRHPAVPAPAPPVVVEHQEEESTLGERAVAVARKELEAGVAEVPLGANTSPRIAQYFARCVRDFRLPDGTVEQRRLGIVKGAWCAAFASFCGFEGAGTTGAPPHAYRASVAELWKDAVASGAARPPSYVPRIGDLAIYMRDGNNPTLGGIGHVARVCAEVDGQGVYETIEGNVGDRVTRVRHKHGDTVGWIAYDPAGPRAAEGASRAAAPPMDLSAADLLLRFAEALTAAPVDDDSLLHATRGAPRAAAPEAARSPEYSGLLAECEIRPERLAEVDAVVDEIAAARERYEAVAAVTRVPWHVIAVLHALECDLRFDRHLHNGDRLRSRTVHRPAGRPAAEPPFTWEQSAEDALEHAGFTAWDDWSVTGTLRLLERHGGAGYRGVRPPIHSPYLWGASNHYTAGLFVVPGHYDPEAVFEGCGAAVLLLRMKERAIIAPPPEPARGSAA